MDWLVDVHHKSQRGASSELNGTFVKNRKRRPANPGKTGHVIRVGWSPNRVEQPAKDFRFIAQLGM